MHVMHLIDSMHGGGAESSILEVAPDLLTRGIETSRRAAGFSWDSAYKIASSRSLWDYAAAAAYYSFANTGSAAYNIALF